MISASYIIIPILISLVLLGYCLIKFNRQQKQYLNLEKEYRTFESEFNKLFEQVTEIQLWKGGIEIEEAITKDAELNHLKALARSVEKKTTKRKTKTKSR
jgi:hypothetical protein